MASVWRVGALPTFQTARQQLIQEHGLHSQADYLLYCDQLTSQGSSYSLVHSKRKQGPRPRPWPTQESIFGPDIGSVLE